MRHELAHNDAVLRKKKRQQKDLISVETVVKWQVKKERKAVVNDSKNRTTNTVYKKTEQ